MVLRGFVGPTYSIRSTTLAMERCINLFPESLEVPWERAQIYYLPTPGLVTKLTLPDVPTRGLFYQDGRAFAVSGTSFYEIYQDYTYHKYGTVALDSAPASMVSNGYGGHQLLVLSGGSGYIFDLIANTFTPIDTVTYPAFPTTAILCGFIDGYFVVLDSVANTMHLSGLFDGLSWSGLDVAQRSTASDNLVSMAILDREVRLFGTKTGETWYDVGAADFPFAPIPGSYISQGSVAPWTPRAFDNSIAWVSSNADGSGMVMKAQGYAPQRISSHALELAMNGYPTFLDAESWVWQYNGHLFYVLYFPSGNATWVFDASTSMWHEWAWTNAGLNTLEASRARCHMYAWGVHLVGDRMTGDVHLLSASTYSDNGVAVQRIRRSPHVNSELDWVFHTQFELDGDTGIGLPSGQGVSPQVALSWSDDGGQVWSNEYWQSMGAQGVYNNRVQWSRLGRARNRIYQVRMTDPVPWRLNNAYLNVEKGTS